MNAKLDRAIRDAINEKRILEFSYDDRPRTAEPHDYGLHRGVRKVLCYQVGGPSSRGAIPDWRTFMFDRIEHVRVSKARFAGARAVSGEHIAWEELFASVSRKPFTRRR